MHRCIHKRTFDTSYGTSPKPNRPKSNRTDFVNKALLLIEHGADLRHGCFGSFSLTMAVQTRNIRVTKKILELLSMGSSNGRVDVGTVDWHGPRHDLQPGGGTSLHGAVSTNAFTIGVSKILVGHAGAGPGVQEMIKKGEWRAKTNTDTLPAPEHILRRDQLQHQHQHQQPALPPQRRATSQDLCSVASPARLDSCLTLGFSS